ncbi:MAG: alpha/beta hydrolase [Chloroflexi bacterium]|nr:alpha/beta hydrolase [Chloroflexota bacterium]
MLRLVPVSLGLVLSISALLITLWIVTPAPLYQLWLVAVGAGEWSLWFGTLGLVGVILSGVAISLGSRWPAWIAIICGLLAVVFALVPPLQSRPVAQANQTPLSLRRYLFGPADLPNGTPQTETFATVDGQTLNLDIYQSGDQARAPRPAIVVVHGGSWSGGDKSDFPQWDWWLTQQGFVVFDVQYRLMPQPNWQTATGDVKCAIGWVKRNAAQYNIDPQRIALLGRSAGGHLALLAAYTPQQPDLPPSCDAPDTGVSAVISFYGPADLVWGYNNPADPDVIDGPGTLRRFLGGDPQTASAAFAVAAPINHVSADTPPTLLFHGGRDQLVGQHHAELLVERLQSANVPHQAVFIPYAQHGFDYNFSGWGSQIAQPVILRFLQTYVTQR